MAHFFTVDLEEWDRLGFAGGELIRETGIRGDPFLVRSTLKFLDMFDEHGCKATFFVLGETAERFPDLVREIDRRGHEIASHGFSHLPLYELDEGALRDEIARSRECLGRLTRQPVVGFRAPHLSIGRAPWAFDVLAAQGFLYDSSMKGAAPDGRPLPGGGCEIACGGGRKIVEMPVSAIRFAGHCIPFSGGTYFRMLPAAVIRRCTTAAGRRDGTTHFYFHPRELERALPRLRIPFADRLRYAGHWGDTEAKIRWVLSHAVFTLLRDHVASAGG